MQFAIYFAAHTFLQISKAHTHEEITKNTERKKEEIPYSVYVEIIEKKAQNKDERKRSPTQYMLK